MDMGSSSMNMGNSTMSMPTPSTGTATASAATAASTGMSMGGMGGMSMGGSDPRACKISMLWNWYTIDSCFLARSWHVNSRAQFAGTCIGVILLVIALEALRRLSKEYDSLILRKHIEQVQQSRSGTATLTIPAATTTTTITSTTTETAKDLSSTTQSRPITPSGPAAAGSRFRPSLPEQAIRALLHMLQFALAYMIMLLAMYYNGYIIISIFIGAYVGAFIFSWQNIEVAGNDDPNNANGITYCCG